MDADVTAKGPGGLLWPPLDMKSNFTLAGSPPAWGLELGTEAASTAHGKPQELRAGGEPAANPHPTPA